MQRPTMNVIPATPTAHKGEWSPDEDCSSAGANLPKAHTENKQTNK